MFGDPDALYAMLLIGLFILLVTGIIFIIDYLKFKYVSKEGENYWKYLKDDFFFREDLVLRKQRRKNEPDNIKHKKRIECPFCAELIKENAKLCRFCGNDIPAD